MQVWALVLDSLRDALDRKVFWILAVISVAIAAAMACITFDSQGIDVLFGTWRIPSSAWALGAPTLAGNIAAVMAKMVADTYIGWIGLVLGLIATASVFPSLMAPGTVEIVVSKPISRTGLFLGKYLGAMVFMLLQATFFVALTFLVIGLRWRHWIWGYWCVVPLVVVLFSYLFAFSALFGVWTRRTVPALLLTLVAWVVIWTPQTLDSLWSVNRSQWEESAILRRVARTVRVMLWVVPKTQDIPEIAGKVLGASLVSDLVPGTTGPTSAGSDELERLRQAEQSAVDRLSAWQSIGSSLLSEAVVVLLGIWRFRRADF